MLYPFFLILHHFILLTLYLCLFACYLYYRENVLTSQCDSTCVSTWEWKNNITTVLKTWWMKQKSFVGGLLSGEVRIRERGSKKSKTWPGFLYALSNHHVGSHHCVVSSSFVCSADFLMRGFWRRMTERSACSVREEGHLKEMSNALSMDTPNTRSPPPTQMSCWQLGSTIRPGEGWH